MQSQALLKTGAKVLANCFVLAAALHLAYLSSDEQNIRDLGRQPCVCLVQAGQHAAISVKTSNDEQIILLAAVVKHSVFDLNLWLGARACCCGMHSMHKSKHLVQRSCPIIYLRAV